MLPDGDSREIVVWCPPEQRPEVIEETERKAKIRASQDAEADSRIEVAKARKLHAAMQQVGGELVLHQLRKFLRLSQSPDFEHTVGPLEPAVILKLAEFLSKNYRLDNGQATENVAHAIGPSIDFSKLSQEERDAWRALAVKGGAGDE